MSLRFKRIAVKKGASVKVEIPIKADDLRFFDETKDAFILEAGDYEIQLGASSDDIRLTTKLTVN